jgi:hypothetical protein
VTYALRECWQCLLLSIGIDDFGISGWWGRLDAGTDGGNGGQEEDQDQDRLIEGEVIIVAGAAYQGLEKRDTEEEQEGGEEEAIDPAHGKNL